MTEPSPETVGRTWSQASRPVPRPLSNTTTGVPEPPRRTSSRCVPMSTSAAAGAAGGTAWPEEADNAAARATAAAIGFTLWLRAQREAFVPPALHPADHLLDRPSQAREADGGAVGAVAMRARAVHDEERVRRVLADRPLVDLSVGEAGRARQVAGGEEGGSAHVEGPEAGSLRAQPLGAVPAVRLQA